MAIKPVNQALGGNKELAKYPNGNFDKIVDYESQEVALPKGFVDDILGFLETLWANTGITPSGQPDSVNASQIYNALLQTIGNTVVSQDAKFIGEYLDEATLVAANANATQGDTAVVTTPTISLYWFNSGNWQKTTLDLSSQGSGSNVQSDLAETDPALDSFVQNKNAENIAFDDTASGTGASTVQEAIDTVATDYNTLETRTSSLETTVSTIDPNGEENVQADLAVTDNTSDAFVRNKDASNISFNDTNSQMGATNAQDAIESVDSRVDLVEQTLASLSDPANPIIASVSMVSNIDATGINADVLTLTSGLVDFLGAGNRVAYDFTPEIAEDVRLQISTVGADVSLLQNTERFILQFFDPDLAGGTWVDLASVDGTTQTILGANVALNLLEPVTGTIGLDTFDILTSDTSQTGDVALFLSDWFAIPTKLKSQSPSNSSADYLLRVVFESTNTSLADVNVSIGRVSFEIRGGSANLINGTSQNASAQDVTYTYTTDSADPTTATNLKEAVDRIITKVDGGLF